MSWDGKRDSTRPRNRINELLSAGKRAAGGAAGALCSWSTGVCDDGTVVTHACAECAKNLCPGCRAHHGQGLETQAHIVVPLPLPLDGGGAAGAPGGAEASAGKEEEKTTEGVVENAGGGETVDSGTLLEVGQAATAGGLGGKDGGGAIATPSAGAELLKICKSDDAPNMGAVRELLNAGDIDLGVVDENGSTALMWALCYPSSPGHAAIVEAMVEREPRLLTEHCREVNTFGKTLLTYASEFGHTAIVAALLEVDSSAEHVRMAIRGGHNSLILASREGHEGIVRALLEVDPLVEHIRTADKKSGG